MKAMWNGTVVAESNDTIIIEGNHYFPPDSLHREYFRDTSTHTTCPWKGTASYADIVVGGEVNPDAAWSYPSPKDAAADIAGYWAFWKGVTVTPA